MNLFGKKKEAPKVDPAIAVINIRQQLDTLEKREAHLSTKVDQALKEAKVKAAKKDKNGALFALKRKKMYEGEISKLQGAKITLESQAMSLESAAGNVQVLNAMKQGAVAMASVRGNMYVSFIIHLIFNHVAHIHFFFNFNLRFFNIYIYIYIYCFSFSKRCGCC